MHRECEGEAWAWAGALVTSAASPRGRSRHAGVPSPEPDATVTVVACLLPAKLPTQRSRTPAWMKTGVGCAPGRTVEAPCCRYLVSWGRRWSTIWAGSARQPTSAACSSNLWERGAASRYRAPPSRGSWSARCAGRRSTRRSPALTSSGITVDQPHGAEGRQPQGGRWRARPSQPRHHAIYAKLDLPTLHKVALPWPGSAPMTPPSFDRLVLFFSLAGSSPRGRGTPVDRAHRGHSHRFIPARAGNTLLARS